MQWFMIAPVFSPPSGAGIVRSQGSDAGGRRTARFYGRPFVTKLNALDPEAYLVQVLVR